MRVQVSRAPNGGNPAGQRRAGPYRLQVDFNPVSTSCGYRVSCAEMLEVDGFSRQTGGVSWHEPAVSLIFSPSLNDLPEKSTMSELFAGFSRHV